MARREACEKFFHDADKDKDGFLSFDEFKNGLKSHGYRGNDVKIRALFVAADENADGKVSFEEFLAVMDITPPTFHKEALSKRLFMQFDLNGDGVIDKHELEQVFKKMGRHLSQKELTRMIEMVDLDQSGVITFEAFHAQIFGNDNGDELSDTDSVNSDPIDNYVK